jgi:HSP20 family molecular chaperone IbpA
MSLSRWIPWGLSTNVDPFLGFEDTLSDYDRQFRRLSRDLNRLERHFLGPTTRPLLEEFPLGLTSLIDQRTPAHPHYLDQEGGGKVAQYNFDVKGFRPEDIRIKTSADGRHLVVRGKHEDNSEHHHVIRKYRRKISLPHGVNVLEMKTRLRPDGILTVSVPVKFQPPPEEERLEVRKREFTEIPIEHGWQPKRSITQQQSGQSSVNKQQAIGQEESQRHQPAA